MLYHFTVMFNPAFHAAILNKPLIDLNSCNGNDAFWGHSVLVKQSSSFSRKHRTLYLQICVMCPPNILLTTECVDWCRNVCTLYNTCPRHQPLWPATWSSTSLTHGQAYHKTHRRSSRSMEKAVTCKHEAKGYHWTSAKLKPALFRAANSLPRKTRCFALFPSQLFKNKQSN